MVDHLLGREKIILIPGPLPAVASRLGRRRPLPRTALGFGDLFSRQELRKAISDLHVTVEILTGEPYRERRRANDVS